VHGEEGGEELAVEAAGDELARAVGGQHQGLHVIHHVQLSTTRKQITPISLKKQPSSITSSCPQRPIKTHASVSVSGSNRAGTDQSLRSTGADA
jgi:hypothetical protein